MGERIRGGATNGDDFNVVCRIGRFSVPFKNFQLLFRKEEGGEVPRVGSWALPQGRNGRVFELNDAISSSLVSVVPTSPALQKGGVDDVAVIVPE
jgi:hypothetical protein